ncbi:MAG TPA: hypothetical protein IGS40_14155 [Trichormus sp. M33_DOE_039]|nr:hypothetical protein [Trichormus sp. M33_DOE_039]
MNEAKDKYQTIDEIESIIKSFNNCTLPRNQWDHHAHLTVALWYLIHYQKPEVIYLIRESIQKYNQSMNIITTNNSGYHETMTLFWIDLVSQYLKNNHAENCLLTLTNQLIHEYGDKNLVFDYYSKNLIMSCEALQNWVNPDLQPIMKD